MLIKIGDVWIDPVRVEVIETLYEDTKPKPPMYTYSLGGFVVTDDVDGETFCTTDKSPTAKAIGVAITTHENLDIRIYGVTTDEAAQAINRCREQSMGRK